MNIFGIGLNKTGTTSLAEAFQILGFRVVHDHELNRQLVASLRERRQPEVLNQYDIFLDGPLCDAYRLLAERFPDALFVLTTRDLERWINSRIIHVLKNRILRCSDWRDIDTRAWAEQADCHRRQVREYFGRSHRLLELNICGGDGWEKLCPWLGKPVPRQPFPRRHDSLRYLDQIRKYMATSL